jgi:N-acetylmuramoyl-L-alanine amidase
MILKPNETPTGTDLLALARKHVGERYVLGVQVPKDAPDYRGPWDCAEFASWLVFQVSGRLFGCVDDNAKPSIANAFSGSWGTDAKRLGKIITIQETAGMAGSFAVRIPGQAGIKIGHVVVSDGSGGTVEAHSHIDGVIKGTLNGRTWTFGICIPWLVYSGEPAAESPSQPTETVLRLTSPPMTGSSVKAVQRQLKAAGFSPGKVDGLYSTRIMTAVSNFQHSKGLVPDGEVGKITAKALAKAAAKAAR